MSGPAKSILGRLSRFHTRDADEARAFLSTKDYELDLSRSDARQTDLRINGVYLPGAYVGYYQFGAPLVARTHAAPPHYWINQRTLGKVRAQPASPAGGGDRGDHRGGNADMWPPTGVRVVTDVAICGPHAGRRGARACADHRRAYEPPTDRAPGSPSLRANRFHGVDRFDQRTWSQLGKLHRSGYQ